MTYDTAFRWMFRHDWREGRKRKSCLNKCEKTTSPKPSGIINNHEVFFVFIFFFQRFHLYTNVPSRRSSQFYADQMFFLSLHIFLKHSLLRKSYILRVKDGKRAKRIPLREYCKDDNIIRNYGTLYIYRPVVIVVVVCSCALIFTCFFLRAHFIYCLSFHLALFFTVRLFGGPFKLITSRGSRVVSLDVRQPFRYGFSVNAPLGTETCTVYNIYTYVCVQYKEKYEIGKSHEDRVKEGNVCVW